MRWILLLLALVLAACGEATDARGSGDEATVLDGRYAGVHDALPQGAVLEFDDGDLRMNAGCNQLFATYRLNGDRLRVEGIGGTEMGCEPALMAADEWLAGFFAEPVTVADGRLVAGDVELAISRDEIVDAELTGTRWVLDGLVEGKAVSSLPTGVSGYLRISSDGEEFGMSSGCNTGGGQVEVGEESLSFGDRVSTAMGCVEDKESVEKHFVGVVTGEATYEISGQTLTITNGDRGLVFRAAERDRG